MTNRVPTLGPRHTVATILENHPVFRAASWIARPTALLLFTLALSACVGTAGAIAPSAPPSKSPTPVDPDRPIFSVTWDGGFVGPGTILGRLPVIVVYPDGRVIVQGPQIEIYPGPLMPNLQERTLTPAALARLIELARDRDLLRTIHYDFPGIADATDTILTINLDGATYRVSAYALTEAAFDLGPGSDDAMPKGRAALRDFIDVLSGLPASDYVDAEHSYVAKSIRVYAGKDVLVSNDDLPIDQPAVAWPLEDLATAGEAVVNRAIDVRCQVIIGDDLLTVMPLLQGANSLTAFVSGGEPYGLIVRPMLPGETGC